ncbi:MAG: zinc-dependent alcohol dehydrogenase [Ilumatobacteraceae bacterium]
MIRALRIDRRPAKLALARLAGSFGPAGAVRLGPLELSSIDPPALPGTGWHRIRPLLSGICGSDLSLVEGRASTYFLDWVSFPFVPGHEVVGLDENGRRVVIEPVLGHAARDFPLPFPNAAPGDGDDYAHLVGGALEPGIQTGFCCSTGGGWSDELVAHESQIHQLPDELSDERAVLVEPLAGGIHAALSLVPAVARARSRGETPVVGVLGAGTMGLAAILGLRRYLPDVRIVVGARYPHQQTLARAFGADVVVADGELARAVRREVGCHVVGDYLSGGSHATIDAVGNSNSIASSLRFTRPRGTIALLGMPAAVDVDLTGLWHRETAVVGAYTYGTETMPDGTRRRTFHLAIETAVDTPVDKLLSATYRLEDYEDALSHASTAGRRGAVKIAFDLRSPDSRRTQEAS